jgi:hypothetical protein
VDQASASGSSRTSASVDALWSAQDRVRLALAGAFERIAFPLQERVLWPLADRTATLGGPARALSFAAVLVLAAAAGVGGLLWAAPEKQESSAATQVAVTSTIPPAPAAAQTPPPPTLQGATPVFEPEPVQRQTASDVDPAKAIVGSAPAQRSSAPPASEPADAAAATASSSSAKKADEVDGAPAGPAALAVARDFSAAFVLYETGNSDAEVRKTLGETATPELAKALLRRPPRLPANIDVPKAKVVNIVAAPSQGGIFPVSVSLLRVGAASELRLDMEQRKGDRWRVTNVLG